MRIIEDIGEMKAEAAEFLVRRMETGLVPTMGALHRGHLSLVDRSTAENDLTIMSIFVNPTQFMQGEDFDSYPRTWKEDLEAAAAAGVDIIFHPSAEQMYSPRAQTSVQVHGLTRGLCGMSRGQGHFRGVATVVAKLFNLVRPTRAYFGQKDAQQALVIQRMVIDLNFPLEIVVCPTVREEDGLAMSSRNRNLSQEYREPALALRRALIMGRNLIRESEYDAATLTNAMSQQILEYSEIDLDYLDIVSPESLENVKKVDDLVLIAGAIKVGGVRLIDNLLVGPDGPWDD
ncbi:MAG: pantoate--beta-alanine ligase [Planctomycetes bacterium]|nr:pantoate--beta-alanine ligase [Planctomycetota bacterium]